MVGVGLPFRRNGRQDVYRCRDEIDMLRIHRILVVLIETLLGHGVFVGRAVS